MVSRIPVSSRKDEARAGRRQVLGSASSSLPGSSSAEKPTDKGLQPGPPQSSSANQPTCTDERLLRPSLSFYSLPGSSSAKRPTDKRDKPLLSSSSFSSLPIPKSVKQPTEKRLLPRLSSSSLISNSAEQPIDKRLLLSTASSCSLLKSSSAERLAYKRKLSNSSPTSSPGSSFAKQRIGKQLPSDTPSLPLPKPRSIAQATDQLPTPSSYSTSLLELAQSSSAEQPTDNQLLAEQTNIVPTNGRQAGHRFANSVARDNSRVHYGDNYNATHHHNYQGPGSDDEIPRNLEDAIARDKVKIYLNHVMRTLSFESMGSRKGTVAPALINTCQWLLDSSEYISWRNPDQINDHHGFMWIKSKAGAGKSTMMKFLLESTRSQHSGDTVISFFFNARGDWIEKTLNGLYRHLLHQLLSSVSRLKYAMVDDINKIASQGWQLQPLKDLLRRAVLDLRSERFTCFIDALDETSEDEIRELVDFFEELSNDVVAKQIRFRVCFSSRHYPNVGLEKCRYLNLDNKREHENDIALYIQSKLKPRKGGIPDNLPALVQKKAQGVFLWVVLVTQILKKDYDRGNIHKAHSRLESIPPGLHSLFYEMIYRNVDDRNDNKDLLSVLQWIAFARQPLTPEDLYYAVRSEHPDFHISQIWRVDDVDPEAMKLFILNCSKGLAELAVSGQRPTIQFIHESVRDFLNETGFDVLTPGRTVPLLGFAHENLKKCCLRWLNSSLHGQITRHLAGRYRSRTRETRHYPLLSYVLENIIEHAELACTNGVPQESFIKIFPVKIWTSLAKFEADPYMFRGRLSGTRDSKKPLPPSLTEIFAYYKSEALLAIELGRIGPRLLSRQYESALSSALITAPSRKAMRIFEFLLQNGSPSHSSVKQQTKTVMLAMETRNTVALKLLLKYGKHSVPGNVYATFMRQVSRPADEAPWGSKYAKNMPKANLTTVPAAQTTVSPACLQNSKAVATAAVNDRPHHHAIAPNSRNQIAQILLEHGADCHAGQGKCPPLLEIEYGGYPDCAELQ